MLKTTIGRLRAIGMAEGVSYIALLGIAMPLKYFGGKPMAVTIAGSIHGGLFVLFCWALLDAKLEHKWSIKKALKPFIASLLPFGPFVIDRSLKAEDEAAAGAPEAAMS